MLVVGVGIATLAGCTAAPAPSDEWSTRMGDLFYGPNGGGGGASGDLGDSGTSARAGVELAVVPSGEYDVLAVCTGTGIVHIVVKSSISRGKVLAASDIACGATLRLPFTLTAPGVDVEAINKGTPAQWLISIVTRGWEPAPHTWN